MRIRTVRATITWVFLCQQPFFYFIEVEICGIFSNFVIPEMPTVPPTSTSPASVLPRTGGWGCCGGWPGGKPPFGTLNFIDQPLQVELAE